MSIKNYLKLSEPALNINSIYTDSISFKKSYFDINEFERESYINHYIINNMPHAFQRYPILYEQIIKYMADELEINTTDIKIIGSAKTGFSISPNPDYGKPFSIKSDYDFSIINKDLFDKLVKEFSLFQEMYLNKDLVPRESESKYWADNIDIVTKNINRGFIDSYKIPNRDPFPTAKFINNILYLIPTKLNEYHKIPNSKASLRIYQNWNDFNRQLKINTENILKNI